MQARFSVCVYCGARAGGNAAHVAAADRIGRGVAEAGWRLVYGAGDVGLMGRVAAAAMGSGGEAMGVIPQHLVDREVAHRSLTTLVVTETMHERKKVMLMNAQAILVLPGGAGTLDEFFEALTWRQLGLHRKPIIILNSEGYWDPLLALIAHLAEQGFAGSDLLRDTIVANDADAALEMLAGLAPVPT